MKVGLVVFIGVAGLLLGADRAETATRSHHVLVTLRDSSVVEGEAMELAADAIRLDPVGPVSLRTIPAAEVAYVNLVELGRTATYPLTAQDLDALRRSPPVTRPSLQRQVGHRPQEGFRTFALSTGAGVSSTFDVEEGGYYRGFGAGPDFALGVRFFVPAGDPQEHRVFLGLSYAHSSPRPDIDLLSIDLGAGDRLDLELGSLSIDRIGGEVGVTTPTLGPDSYLYALLGITSLKNKLSAKGTLYPFGGPPEVASASVKESLGAVRLGAGAVVALSHRLGLELSGVTDLLFAGTKEIPGYNQSVPVSNGGLWGFNAGLSVEL